MKNPELVKKLQFGHGEWAEDMVLVCKRISHVVEVLPFIKSPINIEWLTIAVVLYVFILTTVLLNAATFRERSVGE